MQTDLRRVSVGAQTKLTALLEYAAVGLQLLRDSSLLIGADVPAER